MANVKINLVNPFKVKEAEDLSQEYLDCLYEGIFEAFGDCDSGFKIIVISDTPKVGYQVDLETFVPQIPDAETLKEFLSERSFNIESIVMHNDALLLNIYRR